MDKCLCAFGNHIVVRYLLILLFTLFFERGFFNVLATHYFVSLSGQQVPSICLSLSSPQLSLPHCLGYKQCTTMTSFTSMLMIHNQVPMLICQDLQHLSHLPGHNKCKVIKGMKITFSENFIDAYQSGSACLTTKNMPPAYRNIGPLSIILCSNVGDQI